MKSLTNDWLLSAESDLATIKKIADDQFLTHQVAFHSQQAVEKSFKAIIEQFELGFIKSHSLNTLYGKVSSKWVIKLDVEILMLLDQLYIESRYPGDFGLLPNGKPSIEQAAIFYEFAQMVYEEVRVFLK